MNRYEMLCVSLQSWLCESLIDEIIIVDWNSKKSLSTFAELSPRINVIRVEGKQFYQRSAAINVGLSEAKGDVVMIMDVDYILNPYYSLPADIVPDASSFYTGAWELGAHDGKLGFLGYTAGFMYARKETIMSVGGYNEDFEGYGYEDGELIDRLAFSGFAHKIIALHKKPYLYHNPHPSSLRTANHENKDVVTAGKKNLELRKSLREKRKNSQSHAKL